MIEIGGEFSMQVQVTDGILVIAVDAAGLVLELSMWDSSCSQPKRQTLLETSSRLAVRSKDLLLASATAVEVPVRAGVPAWG